MERLVFAPAARDVLRAGLGVPGSRRGRLALDRLAGYTGPDRFDSSSRFQDQPGYRASSAFSGRAGAGWIGLWAPPDARIAWISWTTPRPLRLSSLRPYSVQRAGAPSDGGADELARRIQRPAAGRREGTVDAAERRHRAQPFRVTVLDAAFPATVTGASVRPARSGIGSVSLRASSRSRSRAAVAARAVRHGCGVGRRPPGAAAPRGSVADSTPASRSPPRGVGAATAADAEWAPAYSGSVASRPVQRRSAALRLAGAVAGRIDRLGRPRRRPRPHRPELGERRAGRAQRPVLAGARREL